MKTFGSLTLYPRRPGESLRGRPHWRLVAEPHVLTRAKRLFERAAKSDHGGIWLLDTPEVGRELSWFCERYPLLVSPAAHLDAQAEAHFAQEQMVAEILAGRYEAPIRPLAIPARAYQVLAAEMLLRTGRLLLADDVGLGKTASAICAMTDPRMLPALVVTLTHLPRQWEREIARFAPHLRTHVITKGTPYPLTKDPKDFPDVIITNYHKISKWADELAPQIRSVIYDEAQELRTGDRSLKYAAARHLSSSSKFRLGLTATPIYNYGGEIYHVIDAIAPDALGTEEEFYREYCNGPEEKARVTDPKVLGTYLRSAGLMLRRTRVEVGRELPELSKVVHAIDTDEGTLQAVSGQAAELARIILAKTEQMAGQKMRASEELSNLLRQATGVAKAAFVAEFVRLLVETGERVVLYGWHRLVYEIWKEKLKDLGPAFYTGTESVNQKAESVRKFVEGETKVIILSLRAGAGLDGLQKVCRTVVYGELDWSPQVHDQCTGRVYRDGQTDPVVAYFLVSDSGSDPIVSDVLGFKKSQSDGIRDPNASLIEDAAGPGNIRKLAEEFLRQRGIAIPA